MKFLVLLLISAGVVSPAAWAVVRGRIGRRAPTCPSTLVGRPLETERSKHFARTFAAFEQSFDPQVRIAALGQALNYYRDSLRDGGLGRSFRTKLSKARTGLYRHLFDENALVRANAAFAIAALQSDEVALHHPPVSASGLFGPDEALIKREVERFARAQSSQPFVLVHVLSSTPGTGGWTVQIDVDVTNELPIAFASGPVTIPIPNDVGPVVDATVRATDLSGFVRNESLVRGRVTDGRLSVRGIFTIKVPTCVSLERASVFLDVQMNGHALGRVLLPGVDLVRALVGHGSPGLPQAAE